MTPEELAAAEQLKQIKQMLGDHEQKIADMLKISKEEFVKEKEAISQSFGAEKMAHFKELGEQFSAGQDKTQAQIDAITERAMNYAVKGIIEKGSEKTHTDALGALHQSFGAVVSGDKDLIKQTALNEGTNSQGGYLVPIEQASEILRIAATSGWVLAQARTVPMASKTLTIPRQLTGVVAGVIAEAGDLSTGTTANEPTFDQVTLTAQVHAVFSVLSSQLEEDDAAGIGAFLALIMGEALGTLVDSQSVTGDGTGVNATGITVHASTTTGETNKVNEVVGTGALTYDKLVDTMTAVHAASLGNAKWVMNLTNLGRIMKLKDSANMPIWATTTGGPQGFLLGYPIIIDSQMADTTILFGDPQKLLVGSRRGLTIVRSGHYLFNKMQDAVRMTARLAPTLGLPHGWVKLTGLTS